VIESSTQQTPYNQSGVPSQHLVRAVKNSIAASQHLQSLVSHQPNSTSTTATTRKQSVVDELNRRNSVVSAASVSSNPFLESEGLPIKQTDLDNKPPTSDFISYGNNRKNVSSALDETQNGMKGIPSVTGSSMELWYDIDEIRLKF
jgi:hypothetical protein